MSLGKTVRRLGQLGATVRSLRRIADGLEVQNSLLRRLADKYAPAIQDPSKEDLRDTGQSFGRDEEHGRVLEFIEKVHRATGRDPTDEEITEWLDGRAT